MQVLHEFHSWPHKEGVGLLHETQRWNVSTFFEFQSNGGEGEGCEHQLPKVRWKGRVFFKWISDYLKEHGIQRKYSCSYSPQQNGVAEKKNRHIVEITCAMFKWEEFAKLLLGWNGNNYNLYHESNTHSGNSWHDTWRKIHKQETRYFTPQSVWLHCIGACF